MKTTYPPSPRIKFFIFSGLYYTSKNSRNSTKDEIQNLELSKIELKNENRKLEYEIKRFQEKLARLTAETGAAEDTRLQLVNELLTCKSQNDQLKIDNRRLEIQKKKYQTESKEKNAQLEKYEKENYALIKCKILG